MVAAKFALLIGAILQFIIAVALLGSAVYIYLKRMRGNKNRETSSIVGVLVLLILGIFFMFETALAFAHYLAVQEVLSNSGGSSLI